MPWQVMLLVSVSQLGSGGTETSSAGTGQEELVIRGTPGDGRWGRSPYAGASLVEREIANGRPTLSLGESLLSVPGVFTTARGNFAQDTRISIRGFGARAAFGIRGIRVVLDGIPLTLPDGQSQIDSIDMANIARVEVLRGAAGSLYGNAAGGVLYLESKEASERPVGEVFGLAGGFETSKLAASARGRWGGTSVSAFASRTEIGGFRERSQTEQVVAQARSRTNVSDQLQWSNTIHYVNAPRAEDPGGLTLRQFRDEPDQAAAVNERFQTGESVSQLQVGTQWIVTPSPRHRVEANLHAGLRDFENALPFRTVEFARDFYGALLMYRWEEPDWWAGHRLTVGFEWQAQEDRRGNQGNIEGRPDGDILLAQTENARTLGVFLQERWLPMDELALLGSLRYDHALFEVEDDFVTDGDASGDRTFEQFTAQAGVAWDPLPSLGFFVNVSQSYETPTLSELVNSAPGGGLSLDLDAQRAVSYEVGVRLRNAFVVGEASGFWIDLDDELLAAEDAEGRTIFSNVGASRRIGAEATLRLLLSSELDLSVAYSWLRSTFEDEGREGDRVPGLPEHRVFTRARYDEGGFFVEAELEWVDVRFADDANLVQAPPHTWTELRLGARLDLGAAGSGSLSMGIRNLLDIGFVDNVRINAFGERFFEPGPPLTVFGALSWRFEGGS